MAILSMFRINSNIITCQDYTITTIKPAQSKPDTNQLALDRTVLANERTYQAWIRTGLAALISGLGIEKFMLTTESGDTSVPFFAIIIVLFMFSAVAFLFSAWRYKHLHVRISHLDVDLIPIRYIYFSSLFLTGCSLLALIDLFYTL